MKLNAADCSCSFWPVSVLFKSIIILIDSKILPTEIILIAENDRIEMK